jgi:hypothetical protein
LEHQSLNLFFKQVYGIVEQIPYGKVISYGEIAKIFGRPRGAREVGRAMRYCPEDLPWQLRTAFLHIVALNTAYIAAMCYGIIISYSLRAG